MADKPMPQWLAENWEQVLELALIPASPLCAVSDCDRHAAIRGLCRNHYRNARTAFDPEFRMRRSSHD